MKKYFGYIILGILGIGLFIGLAQLSANYAEELKFFTEYSAWVGAAIYIILMALSIVVAPINTIFLLPAAAQSFGELRAAVYSIIGWLIGSIIAFSIARKLSSNSNKLTNNRLFRLMCRYESRLSRQQYYLLIIFLRIIMPADILSYTLGFLKRLNYKEFFWTTLIGLIPFGLIFVYTSTASLVHQLIFGVVFLLLYIPAGIWLNNDNTKLQKKPNKK